jgi:hypothetical protein
MTELRLRRNTAIFGLVATLVSLTQLPLYFIYEGAPAVGHPHASYGEYHR